MYFIIIINNLPTMPTDFNNFFFLKTIGHVKKIYILGIKMVPQNQ